MPAGDFIPDIFKKSAKDFEQLALAIFQHQYKHNLIYQQYVNALKVIPGTVNNISTIPFLPVKFFKTHKVVSGSFNPEMVFESSGTSGMVNSKHFVKDLKVYEKSFVKGFEYFYGNPQNMVILALLPSYLERANASLVYMVDVLIKKSGKPESGFYLNEFDKLAITLQKLQKEKRKTILIGVTFALLDFAEKFNIDLSHTIIMETGGMKGRREEMVRRQVHDILKTAFNTNAIHSEYGMTELLSQAYSKGDGIFATPPWMRVVLRDAEDPLSVLKTGRGLINVIDLANVHSCSFIATDDVGVVYDNNNFEVLGRRDNSDLRGCSLMVV